MVSLNAFLCSHSCVSVFGCPTALRLCRDCINVGASRLNRRRLVVAEVVGAFESCSLRPGCALSIASLAGVVWYILRRCGVMPVTTSMFHVCHWSESCRGWVLPVSTRLSLAWDCFGSWPGWVVPFLPCTVDPGGPPRELSLGRQGAVLSVRMCILQVCIHHRSGGSSFLLEVSGFWVRCGSVCILCLCSCSSKRTW